MKKRFWLLCFWLILYPVIGCADQVAYMDKGTAEKAVALMQGKNELRLFCQPCGDMMWSAKIPTHIQAINTGYDNLWEIAVNTTDVDLAYIYINEGGKWQNLALLMGLKVHDVSKILPLVVTSNEAKKNLKKLASAN